MPKPWVPCADARPAGRSGMVIIIAPQPGVHGQQLADARRARLHPRRAVHRHQVAIARQPRLWIAATCPHDVNHIGVIHHRVVHRLCGQADGRLSRRAGRRRPCPRGSACGGGGSSSGAIVNFSSTPQTSHRYLHVHLAHLARLGRRRRQRAWSAPAACRSRLSTARPPSAARRAPTGRCRQTRHDHRLTDAIIPSAWPGRSRSVRPDAVAALSRGVR